MSCNSHGKSTTCTFLLSASGFPVINKFQPATCKIYLPAKKALQLRAKFFPKYTTGTLIRRKSSIRRKHESTTRKGTKYTVNKNKLTSLALSTFFFSPFQLTWFSNMDELLLQRMLGAFTHLACYPRELVSWQYSHVIHILPGCVCGMGGGGVTLGKIGWGCAARFLKPLLYLWSKSAIFPTLFMTCRPKIRTLFINWPLYQNTVSDLPRRLPITRNFKLGKLKKVRVIGSWGQMTGNKEKTVFNVFLYMQCTFQGKGHFKGAKRFIDILEKELRSNTLWKSAEPELKWHVLCNGKERKRFTRVLQNKFNVLDYSSLFVLACHVFADMVRVIEGKII